uniref:Uncharacterized protein n=1 Tax=Ixodes ricinus TaxID=34613 RepID=A0A0K8R6M4_IXORI
MRVAPLRIFAASKGGRRFSPTFTVNRNFLSSKRVLERRHYAITASEFYSPLPLTTLGRHPQSTDLDTFSVLKFPHNDGRL